jgi:hypothetical protein
MRSIFWLAAATLLLTGCEKTKCKGATAQLKLDGKISTWDSCSDGRTRTVDCNLGAGNNFECKCLLDQKVVKTFVTPNPPVLDNPGLLVVSRRDCGWDLADP